MSDPNAGQFVHRENGDFLIVLRGVGDEKGKPKGVHMYGIPVLGEGDAPPAAVLDYVNTLALGVCHVIQSQMESLHAHGRKLQGITEEQEESDPGENYAVDRDNAATVHVRRAPGSNVVHLEFMEKSE